MATTIAVLCKLVHHCNTFLVKKDCKFTDQTPSTPLTISIQETFWLFGIFKVAYSYVNVHIPICW